MFLHLKSVTSTREKGPKQPFTSALNRYDLLSNFSWSLLRLEVEFFLPLSQEGSEEEQPSPKSSRKNYTIGLKERVQT